MTFVNKLVYIIIALFFAGNSFSQVSKGDQHYQNMEYKKAIAAYQKALKKKKNSENPELLAKIADAYRFIKDYSNAANYYQLAIQKGSNNPDVFLHDGMILKSIGNYEEAEKQFKKVLEMRPGDLMAMNGLRSCQNIKKWKSKPKEYEAINIAKLNTDKSEFSPVVWNNKLVFVAERESDLIDFTYSSYNDQPFLNVFSAELKNGEPGSVSGFSKRLNTSYHDGPVSFSKDGNTIYFTRVKYKVVKKDKEFVNRARIYIAELKEGNVKKETEFAFNSDSYSVAHPAISPDGQVLFFSSDKPGGFGGMDIYYCRKNSGGWDQPVNLGPDINTSGNEEFPFLRADGILFFSSDGLPGFGGLDVFSAYNVSGKWILRRNEGTGLNDITDDFGVYFVNDNEGYFSSDRPGGKGSDDLYKFKYSSRSEILEGYILTAIDTSKGAPDQKLLLLDNDGNKVNETRTDARGYFKFDNLESEKNYMVQMDENDPAFSDYPRYYYADKDGNIMRATKKDEKRNFVFTALPLKDNSLSDIEAEDDFTIAGNLLFGDKNSPVANSTLVLKDEKGHVIDKTTTNAFGSFAFRKLPAGSNYVIEMEESDTPIPADSRIIVTNKNGKEIKVLKADSRGKFQIKVLAKESSFISEMNAEDKDLVMDLSGIAMGSDKKVLEGSKVYLLDEKGNKIAETTTGRDGAFVFKNLPSSKNYMISLDAEDPTLKGYEKIMIADKNGRVVKELRRGSEFKYKILAADKNVLTEIFVDDPWLEVLELKNTSQAKDSITIIENVYYSSGDWKFDRDGKRVLDKVVKIMKDNPNLVIELSSHTDSKADDSFNLKLSEKRAKFAVDYIISGGIAKKRVTAVGYGEKKLINNCGNGEECTDEQHAQNRRTEFKIVELKK